MVILRQAFRLALSAVLLGLCAHAALAQAPGQYGEQVNVNEVLIDALVTDAHGNIVLGLDKNDFTVRQDGKPVELDSAVFYSNRRFLESSQAAEQLGIDPKQVPDNRYFIVFLHDQGRDLPAETSQLMDAAQRAKDWVQTGLAPNDFVAVVSYDYKLKLQQDFTRDREGLAKAIERAVQGHEGTWPSRTAISEGPSLAAHLPQGKELRDRSERFEDGMRVLADAAASIPGRKNLLLFSRGFGDLDTVRRWQPDLRYYPRMIRSLNAANIAVYAVDLHPAPTSRRHTLADSLSQLADETSGRYYSIFTNFITPLEQVAKENNGYYLLSFQPQPGKGFQKVTVEVKNLELRVKARSGFSPAAG
jgi:VWFA-related protein